jgi:hypothetical protein
LSTRPQDLDRQRNFWDLIAEMRSDPAFEPVDWSKGEVDSWRNRRPARELEWPE